MTNVEQQSREKEMTINRIEAAIFFQLGCLMQHGYHPPTLERHGERLKQAEEKFGYTPTLPKRSKLIVPLPSRIK